MGTDGRVLMLSFPDKDDKGRIYISAKEDGAREADCISILGVPDSFIKAENVKLVSDVKGVNSSDLVQIYVGSDCSLPQLLLLEDERYVVELGEDISLDEGHLKKGIGNVQLTKHRLTGGTFYDLKFSSYVGKGHLCVKIGETRFFEIPFEVRSKKMGYLEEYPRMLSDIAEFSTSLLMTFKSPLYTRYEISDHSRDTFYEDFMVLDYIFSKLDFKGMYYYVRENRHSELIPRTEAVPAGLASYIDPADLACLLYKDNLVYMKGGQIAGKYAPKEVPECIWEDSYDTPENRLVKELVLTLDRKVSKLCSAKAASEDGYVKTRLDKMSKDLIEIVNDRWLMDIGDMRVLPCDSSVLRSRYGYADLFRMYLMLDLGALYKQGDAEGLLKGQNKKLHLVYEYWCYTRLFMCLRDMAEEVLKSPFDLIDEGWTLTIAGHSEFKMRGSGLFVSLYYNRGYSDGLRVLRSYSLRYRPDFTLVIQSQDLKCACVVNFDVKYRLKSSSNNDEDDEDMGEGIGKTSENGKDDQKEKELREDINKMHTYRDALIYSCGAYVLYPGDSEDPVVYKKWEDQQDLETSEAPYIPSVGAIPLSPGKDPVGLRIVLDSVMKNISPLFQGKFNIEDPRAYPLENSKPLNMKEVSAAVIVSGGRVLCFRKGNAKYDYLTGCYEFPGGKLEPGESPKEALIRELNEELDLVLEESELTELYEMKHDYPDFSVNLHYFIIRKDTLDYTLKEHTDCIRSEPKDLLTLKWADADLEVAKLLESGSLKI